MVFGAFLLAAALIATRQTAPARGAETLPTAQALRRPAPTPRVQAASSAPTSKALSTSAAAAAPRRTLRGIVRDLESRPRAATVIARLQEDLFGEGTRVASGEDGRFEIRTPNGDYRLHAEAPGLVGDCEGFGEPHDGDHSDLELWLRPSGTLAGRVLAPDGRPVEGAVLVDCRAAMLGSLSRAVSWEGGVYRMEVVSGRCLLRVQAAGFAPFAEEMEVAAGSETPCDVRLALPVTVTGRVTDTSGNPVAGAKVTAMPDRGSGIDAYLWPPECVSGTDGAYALGGLVAGKHHVGASVPGVGDACYEVQVAPGITLDVVLVRTGRIEGRLVYEPAAAPHGQPSTSWMFSPADTREYVSPELKWSEDDRFTLKSIQPGTIEFSFWQRGYAPARVPPIAVPEGATIAGVVVRMTAGATLRGTVRSARTGDPVQARVFSDTACPWCREGLRNHPDLALFEARTDALGRFCLGGLPPGPNKFDVRSERVYTELTLDVPDGGVLEHDMVLADGARIRGRILTDRGSLPAHGSVWAHPADMNQSRRAPIGADGSFEVTGLGPGECSLWIGMDEDASWPYGPSRIVTLAGQETVDLSVRIRESTLLRGVARVDKQPLAESYLRLDGLGPLTGEVFIAWTGPAGEYSVPHIDPGEYEVRAGVASDFDLDTGQAWITSTGVGVRVVFPPGATDLVVDVDLPARE